MISTSRLAAFRLAPVAVAAAVLFAGHAATAQPGQRYVYLADAAQGTGFIDPGSVRQKGAYKAADMLMVMRPMDGTPANMAYAEVTVEFDCAASRSRVISGVVYDPTGAKIGGGETPDSEFTADNMGEPDSIAVYRVVCQGKSAPGPFKGTAAESYVWAKARF